MDNSTFIVLCVILIYLIYKNSPEFFTPYRKVCNSVDGQCYKIVSDKPHPSHILASEYLAHVNDFAIRLLRHLREKYLWNQTKPSERKKIVAFLLKNYNPDRLIENRPLDDQNTSYVENKGELFAICLRHGGRFVAKDIVEFVTIHEMTHMATNSIGHELDFWQNFKFLLQEAQLAGLYTPVDYSKHPIDYCSLKVAYNPYFDDTLEVP